MPPSPKNTTGSPRAKSATETAETSLPSVDVTATDKALEVVQTEIVAEKDARREERWGWLAVVAVMFDVISFKDMSNWVAPISIVLLELVVLVVLGRKWGIDPIWTLTERIINKWNGQLKP